MGHLVPMCSKFARYKKLAILLVPYLSNRSITIVMPRAPGTLTGENTQECRALFAQCRALFVDFFSLLITFSYFFYWW